MSLEESLDRVIARHEELGNALARPETPSSPDFARMSKEYAGLTHVVEAISGLRKAKSEIDDLTSIINDGESDDDMRALAGEELAQLKESLPELEKNVQVLLLPKDEADGKNAILEVRAGT
ncbi:MAG: PCRF domain-containing protein, partial [Rhodospirillales bacterium]